MSELAFTNAVTLPVRYASRSATCSRRPLRMQVQSGSQYDTPSEWQTAGNGNSAGAFQTIEFIIRQDGRVEEKVTGTKGTECVKVREKCFECNMR